MRSSVLLVVVALLALLSQEAPLCANVAGGGTGTGANVTVTQAGANVTLANGIVSFTIDTANGNVSAFTYNGQDYLGGGRGGAGGYFYIDGSGGPTLANPSYTLTVNPANNGGAQAEVQLQTIASPMDCTLYYDLLRGQQGIYDTLVLTHEAAYPDYPGAELRTNMYVGGIFDWICINPYRFRQMASPNDTYIATPGAPQEVFDFTSGIYSGTTGSKYSYSEELGEANAYGWASTTTDYGVWQTFPSHEYLDAGPMHRELTAHLGNTLLDMFGGGHYGFGLTQDTPAGAVVSKTFGPAFIYANKYTGTSTNVTVYAQALYNDAQAQAAAEQAAWPYTWFNPPAQPGLTGSAYPQASGRATVSGTFAINDVDNAAASPVGMWIGLAPVDGGVDFQQQYLTYQFWSKTGAGGAFSIPNVLPGTYNLWAFGPGAAGTFQQANVTVAAGQALNLGTVTWTAPRLGPTVWEIGVPDRDSDEFNNGDHDVSPWGSVLPPYAEGAPYDTPTDWGAFIAYPTQYPSGVSYTVGVSNYANNWNYCQPTVTNTAGAFVGSTSKIFFNMASAPAAGKQARLYIAFASQFGSACIITINGVAQTGAVVASTDGANAATIGNATTGFYVPNLTFDSIERLGSQGAWGDAYLDFAATDLKAGMNEIDIGMRPTGGASISSGFEYDYIRLECEGFTPSPTPTPQTAGTATSTPIRTATLTASPTATPSSSPTRTASPTATSSASPTHTPSPSATPSSSLTRTPSPSATPSDSPTATATASATATLSDSPIRTATVSATPSPSLSATPSPSSSATTGLTATLSPSVTESPTRAQTLTASPTLAESATATPSLGMSSTPSATLSVSVSATESFTGTLTPSLTPTPSATSTWSESPSATPSATASVSATASFTRTQSPTASPTRTASVTESSTATLTFVPGASASPTQSLTPQFSATPSAVPSATSRPTTPNSGPVVILGLEPVPNPNPGRFAVKLAGPVDQVDFRVYTVAMVLAASFDSGALGPGWNSVDAQGALSVLPNGLYYVVAVPVRGGVRGSPVLTKAYILR